MQVRAGRTALIIALLVGFAPRWAAAEQAIHDHDGPLATGHLCLTVESPCPGPNCNPNDLYPDPLAKGQRIVFLNFEQVTLTKSDYDDNAINNVSAIVNSTTEVIPAFDHSDLYGVGGATRQQVIDYIVDEAYGYTTAYDIEFVTTRPSSGSYHMVKVGGTSSAVIGESGGVLGISILDCGDVMASNVSFAFSGNGNMSVDGLAVTIVHEMAHALGLSHVDHQLAIMNPYVNEGVTPSYQNQVLSIPDGPGCGGATTENSYQVLLNTVGPRGQDTTAPTISISSPTNGAYVAAGTPVVANITDAGGIDYAELHIDSTPAQTLNAAPWTFTIPANTPAGAHMITVRGYDNAGNNGMARINVTITSGDETDCSGDEDCDGDWVCRGDICVPPGTPGTLGDPCATDDDCVSGRCGDVGGEKLCTQLCDASTPCPDGFDCLSETACWPSGDDGGGGGCAVTSTPSPESDGSLPLLLLGALGLAFVCTRRRD